MSTNKKSSTKCIVIETEGVLLTENSKMKERWIEYVEELYTKNEKPNEIRMEKEEDIDADNIGLPILKTEVVAAIKEIKNGRPKGTITYK